MLKISPSLLYPGIVVGLLLMSVSTSFILLRTAQSDGGAQVLDNYYVEALDWDRTQEQRAVVRELGWNLNLQLEPGAVGRLQILDSALAPVDGLQAKVTLRRPQLAEAVSSSELVPAEGVPGLYTFAHEALEDGLWDVILEGQWDERTLRYERRYQVGE